MIEGLRKIEFDSDGFREILLSEGMKEQVESAVERIQSEANAGITEDSEGFSVDVIQGGYGGGRWVGFVSAIDSAAAIAESENKVLSGAVHA